MSSILIPIMAPCSQSKARPAPVRPAPVVQPPVVQPAPVDEEDIDLDDVSKTSDEEDTPPAPPNIPGDATTHVAPITKPVMKSNRALDIDLLFERGKGKPSVCKYCK